MCGTVLKRTHDLTCVLTSIARARVTNDAERRCISDHLRFPPITHPPTRQSYLSSKEGGRPKLS